MEKVTKDEVMRQAGNDALLCETQAQAAAVMDRMEAQVAALQLLDGLDVVLERETRLGVVVFEAREGGGTVIGSATARGFYGGWYVYGARVNGDGPEVAVASAVCLLLAASVASEKNAAMPTTAAT